MEKILVIDDRTIRLKFTTGTLVRYRNNFQRDMLTDMIELNSKMEKKSEDETQLIALENMEMFEKMAWAMAKTADNDIPDLEQWLDQFNLLDFMHQLLPKVVEIMTLGLQQRNKEERAGTKRKNGNKKRAKPNTNTVILRCLKLGMSLSDIDNMTIGFILDLIDENNREATEADQPTEADADTLYRFFN